MICPQCRKTKLELFEEDDYGETPVKRYTCNRCGIFVDVQNITDKETAQMIGYTGDE
jgi:Zn ribbon nucleic-acid-binding protein